MNNSHSHFNLSKELNEVIEHSFLDKKSARDHRTLEDLYQDIDFIPVLTEILHDCDNAGFSYIVPSFFPYLFDVVSPKEMIFLLTIVQDRRQTFLNDDDGRYWDFECFQAIVGYCYYIWDNKDPEGLKAFFQTPQLALCFEQESNINIRGMVSHLIASDDKEMFFALFDECTSSPSIIKNIDEASLWSEAFHYKAVGVMEVLLKRSFIKEEENAFFILKMIGGFKLMNEETTPIVRTIVEYIGCDYLLKQHTTIHAHLGLYYSLISDDKKDGFLRSCLSYPFAEKLIAKDDDFGKKLLKVKISSELEKFPALPSVGRKM